MKTILKRKYVYLSEKPKKRIVGGLKVIFSSKGWVDKICLPIARRDIEKGQMRYSLPIFPNGVKAISAEIDKNGYK